MSETPQPILRRVFEAAAAVMELDHGQTRLELEFDDGHLRRWWTHGERRGALELHRYDGRAAWIARAVRGAAEVDPT